MDWMSNFNIFWWISVVEIPALAGLLWLVWRSRADSSGELESVRQRLETAVAQLREGLAAYKLEVAKSYVSAPWLREVEARLSAQLRDIEAKLDALRSDRRGPP